jgi:polyisoprenoid-binding protein YceI
MKARAEMNWQIDNSHTSIEFSVRHMMISKAKGRFDTFSGVIDLDVQQPERSTVYVAIDAASINTRDEKRDEHLRSADFLNTAEYPQLVFQSTRVERTGDSTAKLYGDLTIRDVTKPVVLNVTFVGQSVSPWGQTVYGFEAETKINRKAWGLEWNVALETGGVLVADEVNISVGIELIKAADVPAEAVAA